MSSMDLLDVGQANEFKLACRRNGFTSEDLKWLCEGNHLAQVRRVRFGYAEIVVSEHLIDCDATPFVPKGWKVEEHQKVGAFKFDASKVLLYLDEGQQRSRWIDGNKLRKRLIGKPVLNANVLDYLLENPHLIPNDWKKDEDGIPRYIFFWGTIYRHQNGDLYVRYLSWLADKWHWDAYWLNNSWRDDHPAAMHATG